MNYSGIVHLIIPIIQSVYCFIFKRNWFDIFYIFVLYFIYLHWSFFNGECIISYWHKKKLDSTYIAGQDVFAHDYSEIFNSTMSYLFAVFTNIFAMYNLYIIFKRNKLPLQLVYAFIIITQIYFFGIKLFDEPYKNNSYLLFQDIYKYLLLLWGIVFLFMFYY